MSTYVIIPGLGNSGPEHWQTWFESQGPEFHRIQQQEWDAPDLDDWLMNIEHALEGQDLSQVVLIGHSLGCSSIAHWAKRYGHTIKGVAGSSTSVRPVTSTPLQVIITGRKGWTS